MQLPLFPEFEARLGAQQRAGKLAMLPALQAGMPGASKSDMARVLRQVGPYITGTVESLGEGAESLVFGIGGDRAARIERLGERNQMGRQLRSWPIIKDKAMLQPLAEMQAAGHSIQIMPQAETIPMGIAPGTPKHLRGKATAAVQNLQHRGLLAQQALSKGLSDRGFYPFDVHMGNIGFVHGHPFVIDPGSVAPSVLQQKVTELQDSNRMLRMSNRVKPRGRVNPNPSRVSAAGLIRRNRGNIAAAEKLMLADTTATMRRQMTMNFHPPAAAPRSVASRLSTNLASVVSLGRRAYNTLRGNFKA